MKPVYGWMGKRSKLSTCSLLAQWGLNIRSQPFLFRHLAVNVTSHQTSTPPLSKFSNSFRYPLIGEQVQVQVHASPVKIVLMMRILEEQLANESGEILILDTPTIDWKYTYRIIRFLQWKLVSVTLKKTLKGDKYQKCNFRPTVLP